MFVCVFLLLSFPLPLPWRSVLRSFTSTFDTRTENSPAEVVHGIQAVSKVSYCTFDWTPTMQFGPNLKTCARKTFLGAVTHPNAIYACIKV